MRFSVAPVWTGSAADYDKPSLHFIGTGEGAQVYGWGLYGSSSEDVARWYAENDAMAKRNADILWDGKPSDIFFREMRQTAGETDDYRSLSLLNTILKDKHGDVDQARKAVQKEIERAEKFNRPQDAKEFQRSLQLLEEYRDRIKYRPGAQQTLTINGEEFVKGQAYPGKDYWENAMFNFLFAAEGDVARAMRNVDEQIDIAKYRLQADKDDSYWQDHLADLQKVKAFLSDKSNKIAYDNGDTGRRNLYQQTFWPGKKENLLDWDTLISKEQVSQIEAQLKKEGLPDKVLPSIAYSEGEELYEDLTDLLGSPKAASEFLYRAGIDGITYVGASSGVRNYVAFSDQDVRVDDHFRFSMGEVDENTQRLVSLMKAAAGYDKTKPGEVYAKKFKEMYGEDIDPKEAKRIAAMAVIENLKDASRRYTRDALQFHRDSDPAFDFFLNFAGPNGKLNPGRDHLGEEFTGTWISQAYREYSIERRDHKTDRGRKNYQIRRENALENAGGTPLDEVAKAYAEHAGIDPDEAAERLLESLRSLNFNDIRSAYSKFRQESFAADRETARAAEEEFMRQEKYRIENEVFTEEEIRESGGQQTDATSGNPDRKYRNASELYRNIAKRVQTNGRALTVSLSALS